MAWFLVTPSAIAKLKGMRSFCNLWCACGGIGPTFSNCSFLETGLDKGLKGLMNHELVSCCKNIQKQSKCGESSWIKHGGEVDDFTRHFTRIFCPLGFLTKQRIPRLGACYYPRSVVELHAGLTAARRT